jgi:hypothetical protein
MMTKHHIQENDIVMKYLRGELSIDQQIEFEQFYLDDPETLDQLEAASALKMHLPRQTSPKAGRWFSLPTMVCSAAGVLLGIALILPFQIGQGPAVQPNIRTIVIDTNRGAESVVRIDRRPGEELIILRLPVATAEEDLTLLFSRNGEKIMETTGLSSDYLGDVLLAVPVAVFGEAAILLTLRRADGTVLAEEQVSVN